MRHNILLLFLPLICLPLYAQDPQKSEDNAAASAQFNEHYDNYKQLVARAKQNDPTVDYVRLIAVYWDIYSKLPKAPNRDEMSQAFKDKDYRRAVELAEVIQDNEFQNRNLHLAMANAYQELGETAKADLKRGWADKIFKAILSTGDGKSPATAYCVQGINEEYQIMRHFGYKATTQAFLLSGYDELSGTEEKTGKPVSLYFDISGNVSRCVNSHQRQK